MPCTAIAIVKIIDSIGKHGSCICVRTTPVIYYIAFYIGEYNKDMQEGEHLKDKIVTVINRSEIVGRPLAAMLANDGAFVYVYVHTASESALMIIICAICLQLSRADIRLM